MDSNIKGEFMLMADSLVTERHREFCRQNTNLNFMNLEGALVPHMEFNNYMQALRQKVGFIGPKIVGRQVGAVVDKLSGALTAAGNVENMLNAWTKIYSDNNSGADSGELILETLTSNSAIVVSTSPLDEGFHIGVGEGFIRFYKKMITKADLKESMTTSSRTVFEYVWR